VELPGELAGATAEWLSAALSQDRPDRQNRCTPRRGAAVRSRQPRGRRVFAEVRTACCALSRGRPA